MADVAALVHDRTVQSILAARLMIQSAISDDQANQLLDRGLESLERAGTQARDLMWVLQPPKIRPDHLEEDLAALLRRTGREGYGPAVSVQADGADPAMTEALAGAIQAFAAGLFIVSGHVEQVVVRKDAKAVGATVNYVLAENDPLHDRLAPWLGLASGRLAGVNGTVHEPDPSTVLFVVPI